MEQLYVVWYSDGNGWLASESMNRQDADTFAQKLQDDGLRVRIHPRPEHKTS